MDRRRVLGTVAVGVAGGLASCTTRRSLLTFSGEAQFDVCGRASETRCREIGIRPDLSAIDGTRDGQVVVSRPRSDRLELIGATGGIDDPDCRETVLDRIRLDGSILRVTVGNDAQGPLFGGSCTQGQAPNYYRLRITRLAQFPSAVHVRHTTSGLDDEVRTEFETTVQLGGR